MILELIQAQNKTITRLVSALGPKIATAELPVKPQAPEEVTTTAESQEFEENKERELPAPEMEVSSAPESVDSK
jgi:hypothetical protein